MPCTTDRWAERAKTAVSVGIEAKPEVEILRQPQNQLFDPGSSFTPSDSLSLVRIPFRHNTKRHRQMTVDRQTTLCTKGTTDIVRSAKNEQLVYSRSIKLYPIEA